MNTEILQCNDVFLFFFLRIVSPTKDCGCVGIWSFVVKPINEPFLQITAGAADRMMQGGGPVCVWGAGSLMWEGLLKCSLCSLSCPALEIPVENTVEDNY